MTPVMKQNTAVPRTERKQEAIVQALSLFGSAFVGACDLLTEKEG